MMNARIIDEPEQIDRKTSRSICDAVGERLQQNLLRNRRSLRISSIWWTNCAAATTRHAADDPYAEPQIIRM